MKGGKQTYNAECFIIAKSSNAEKLHIAIGF